MRELLVSGKKQALTKMAILSMLVAGTIGMASIAWGVPSFGPGNGQGQENGVQKCHPPGQTKGEPGCH
jgi:hypothetical protein